MSRKKKIVSLVFIGAVISITALFLKEKNEVSKTNQSVAKVGESAPSVIEPSANNTPTPIAQTNEATIPSELSEEKLAQIQKCFPELEKEYQMSYASIISELVHDFAIDDKPLLHFDIYHLTLPNGEKRRLRLYSELGHERLQFYKLDQDGDPVVLEIPADDQVKPDHTVLTKYLSQGEISHHEKSYDIKLIDKGELTIIEENGKIIDFTVKLPQGFLGCNQETCLCDNEQF